MFWCVCVCVCVCVCKNTDYKTAFFPFSFFLELGGGGMVLGWGERTGFVLKLLMLPRSKQHFVISSLHQHRPDITVLVDGA